MKTRTFAQPLRVALALGLALTLGLAVFPGVAPADGTVTYTGQGFNFDGTTYNLNDERCGLTGQNDANDGGTGQFADWNGPGQPYEAGQGYLVGCLVLARLLAQCKGPRVGASRSQPDYDHVQRERVYGLLRREPVA